MSLILSGERFYRPDRLTPRHPANLPPEQQEAPRWLPPILGIAMALAVWVVIDSLATWVAMVVTR